VARGNASGMGKGVSVRGMRRWVAIAMVAAALALVGVAASAVLLTTPAHAYDQWQHDGATGCVCHEQGAPTDASCTSCHAGFKSIKGYTCWSCHAPGQDTSSMSATSADCAATCHLQSQGPLYGKEFAHGTNPHRGSLPQCLGCHSPSDGVASPGVSPHHNDGSPGMAPCSRCHKQKMHVGKVDCEACHTDANAFHTYQAESPGFKKCSGCHSMRHAGRTVPASKCASCHKGQGTGAQKQAQHSVTVTKNLTCNLSGCHNKKIHAAPFGSGLTCSSCHGRTYHGSRMSIPGNSTCLRCHGSAARHTNGYACSLCHADAVHARFPHAGSR
jgi:hypothetical protein